MKIRVFSLLLMPLAACPRTDPTQPIIETVSGDGALEAPQFKLKVTGHGFGLSGVVYNLSTKEGTATGASALRTQILTRNDQMPPEITRIETGVLSPTALSVTVDLGSSLAPGIYKLLLFSGPGGEPLATKEAAFEIGPSARASDAGIAPDAATPIRDAALSTGFDDAGAAPQDAAEPVDGSDLMNPDGGDTTIPDASAQLPDTSFGPFPPGPAFRREIQLINDTSLPSPLDITVRIPVPHLAMITAGESTALGSDLQVYLGLTALPHQIEDRALLGTDRLELIVRLPVAIPAGPSANLALALYSDPQVAAVSPASDQVYLFSEHFDLDFPDYRAARRDMWNDRWDDDCTDRLRGMGPQSRCRVDSESGLTRRTLATPTIPALTNTPAANERYEVVAFLRGAMQTTNDLVYFSYGPDNESWELTTLLPDGAYDPAFVPNATLVFQEVNNTNRTVRGYRFPAGGVPFTRMRVSFVPSIPGPHLHLRYISTDNQTSPLTVVGVDDLVVRRALNPDFRVQVGPVERR